MQKKKELEAKGEAEKEQIRKEIKIEEEKDIERIRKSYKSNWKSLKYNLKSLLKDSPINSL